jgi:glycosyltransferase involved in cell wall biosynthesis
MGADQPKILILSAYDVGGASIAAIRMHLGFLESGMESRFLTLHASSDALPQHFQFSPKSDFTSRLSLKLKQRREHQIKNSLKLPEGKSLSGEFSFPLASYDVTESSHWSWADVVIVHWVNEWIQLETLVDKAGSKPLIWVMHDMHAFSGGCHYSHGCEGLIRECQACPMLEGSNLPNLAHQFWVGKSKAIKKHQPSLTITAPSNWMLQWSQRSSLFGHFPHQHIFNSLDARVFAPRSMDACRQALGIPAEKRVLLCVIQSLTDHRKGFSILLEALSHLKKYPNLLLCTVGKHKNLPKELPIDHLHFGLVSDERLLVMLYNSADVFVHPAIEDNLPNVVVEAISCGIPCAGFSIGGMPEMVQNNENGYLSEEINPIALAETIEKTLHQKWEKGKISEEAGSRFSLEIQAAAFQKLIKAVLNKK